LHLLVVVGFEYYSGPLSRVTSPKLNFTDNILVVVVCYCNVFVRLHKGCQWHHLPAYYSLWSVLPMPCC